LQFCPVCYDNEGLLRTLIAITAVSLGVLVPASAQAEDRWKLSGFLGVRTTSEVTTLGTPTNTSIGNSIGLGPRLRFQVFKRFSLETELGIFPSSTRLNQVSVIVLNPRMHFRFDRPRRSGFQPMVYFGVGGPAALSANTEVLSNDIQVEGYAGAAFSYSRGGGLSIRLDVRGYGGRVRDDSTVALGMEVLVGLSYRRKSRKEKGLPTLARDRDSDGDGLTDAVDKCPRRAEDKDGYKDGDGCPDIDDDLDEVLDVADKCRMQPETYNGYKDGDGCPDSLPEDLAAIEGVVENVIFYPRSVRLHKRAKRPVRKLVEVLQKYQGVRITLIGHTDNSGDADANLILSKKRMDSLRDRLVAGGVRADRISTAGRGGESPLYDNETPKNRFKNNRVELKIYRRRKN